jgi:DNA end-binding protein Ku
LRRSECCGRACVLERLSEAVSRFVSDRTVPGDNRTGKDQLSSLNKETGHRIRYRKVDAETGDEVSNDNIIKGYEVAKGEYIELNPDELEAVAIASKRTLEIEEFVPKKDIDQLYLRDPYFIVPDGDVGQQAFAVIRDAIRKEGMVALGKVVFTTREHIIALEARENGLVGTTLRYPYEVRQANDYFDVIEDEKVPKDMLDLVVHIVDSKTGRFEPAKFEDQYENALKELLRKKQKGERIERPKEPARTNVVNLMDALRQSVKAESGSSARRKISGSAERRAAKKSSRSTAKQRKAG